MSINGAFAPSISSLAIIEARIAAHVTQKDSDRPDVAEHQVQRREATEYSGVSVQRLQQVADALGAKATPEVQVRAASDADRVAARVGGGRAGARKGPTRAA